MAKCGVSKTSGPQEGGNIQLCSNRRNVNFHVYLLPWDQGIKVSLVAFSRLKLPVVSRYYTVLEHVH